MIVRLSGRCEKALRDAMSGLSKKDAEALFAQGGVRNADRKLLKKGDTVAAGDTLHVDLQVLDDRPPEQRARLEAKRADLVWLAESPHWVVMRKPAGLPTLGRHFGDTLHFASYAKALIAERVQRDVSSLEEFGVVHRLDNGTSGAVLIATDAPTLAFFVAARGDAKKLSRTYLALVHAKIPDVGVIDTPLPHHDAPARTTYRTLQNAEDTRLLEVDIEGGRRHQIRAHLASIGAPILGDPDYHGGPAPRMALHAWRLKFVTPQTEDTQVVVAEPGAHFWACAPAITPV